MYKIRWFISPDKVLIDDDIYNLDYYSIVSNKKNPLISICKISKYSNNIYKLNTTYSINLLEELHNLKDDVLYCSINIEHNTDYYGTKLFFNAWSIQGILERYISSAMHASHITLFKHKNEVLIKTTFPTVFKDKIYPNIINKNFEDIISRYLPEQKQLFELHKQKEIDYLERNI